MFWEGSRCVGHAIFYSIQGCLSKHAFLGTVPHVLALIRGCQVVFMYLPHTSHPLIILWYVP